MPRIKLEHTLYALAFGLALFLRLLNLGAAPLSDREAALTLQALAAAAPATPAVAGVGESVAAALAAGAQPGYVAATALAFLLFPETNFLARFWPALAGSLLVLAPWFFTRPGPGGRPGLARPAGLIMAFGLALDPGLVTLSRQVGGLAPALAFTTLALGGWWAGRPVLAGISAGLAFLSGPTFFYGLSGLVLAALAGRVLRRRPAAEAETEEAPPEFDRPGLARAALAALATTLLFGSLFGLLPQGLSAFFNSLPRYLAGWLALPETPAIRLVVALLVYQPLALLFGLLGLARLWRRPSDAAPLAGLFALWAGAALLLALLYPARQTADLAWLLVPLWGLAAYELAFYLPGEQLNSLAGLHAAGIWLLGVLFWLNMTGLAAFGAGQDAALRGAFFFGLIALGALLTALVGLGSSWSYARLGLAWGLAAGALFYLVAVGWGSSQVRATSPAELWNPGPAAGQADLLLATLEDLSTWQTGFPQSLELVAAVDSPSLRWALRDFSGLRFAADPPANSTDLDDLPAVIVARPDQAAPALAAAYRGQDFRWRVYSTWPGALPSPFARWLVFREAPFVYEPLIVWARSDLFPGGATQP